MRDYIEERALEIGEYIIEEGATVRQAARKFGISKSTVHKDGTLRADQPASCTRSKEGVRCQQVRASYPGWTCDERKICTYGTLIEIVKNHQK